MKFKLTVLASSVLLAAVSQSFAAETVIPDHQLSNDWYTEGKLDIADKQMYVKGKARAKNVILFVGDGMGVSLSLIHISEPTRRH